MNSLTKAVEIVFFRHRSNEFYKLIFENKLGFGCVKKNITCMNGYSASADMVRMPGAVTAGMLSNHLLLDLRVTFIQKEGSLPHVNSRSFMDALLEAFESTEAAAMMYAGGTNQD